MWKPSKIIWTANIGGCWPDDVPYYCDTLLRVQPTVAGKLAISLHPQFVVRVDRNGCFFDGSCGVWATADSKETRLGWNGASLCIWEAPALCCRRSCLARAR